MNDQFGNELPPVIAPPDPYYPPSRQEIAPPITEEDQPRRYGGWVAAAILFALMVFTALLGAVVKPGNETRASASDEVALKSEVSQRRLTDFFSSQGAPQNGNPADALDAEIKKLSPRAAKDAPTARLVAAMLTEQGKPVPGEILRSIRTRRDAEYAALAEIYAAKSLAPTRAGELASRFPNDTFLGKLSRVQAYEKAGDRTTRNSVFGLSAAFNMFIAVLIGGAICLGCPIAWYAFLRVQSHPDYRPLGPPAWPLSKGDADRLIMRATQIVGLFLLLGIGIGLFRLGIYGTLVEGLSILVVVAILSRFPIDGTDLSLKRVGLSKENLGKNVLWGVAAFFAEFPISLMLMLIGTFIFRFLPAPSHPATEQIFGAKSLWMVIPIVLFGSIAAPIWEEFVFRGLVFPAFLRMTGRAVLAAVLAGFVFAMIHPQGPAAWMGLASVGAMGCGLTYHRRSVVPGIVMHVLHNSVLFFLALLAAGPK